MSAQDLSVLAQDAADLAERVRQLSMHVSAKRVYRRTLTVEVIWTQDASDDDGDDRGGIICRALQLTDCLYDYVESDVEELTQTTGD
jgi:hypothetical protein